MESSQGAEKRKVIKGVYENTDHMVQLRNTKQRYFNDRTLIEFIDDAELRFNSYVPTRESQGKEPWQANFFHPTTRNKVKAICAAAASTVPKIKIRATNKESRQDVNVADIMRGLVKYSRDLEDLQDSVQTDNYFAALELASKGTVIEECAFESIMRDNKNITSYDVATGEYEFEIEKELVRNQCSDSIVPIDELYVWSMECEKGNIQKQQRLQRIKYYTEEEFKDEFSEYKDFDLVKPASYFKKAPKESDERYFRESWSTRVQKSDGAQVEVVREYSVFDDTYRIVANGILLLDVPMLWSYKGEKVYNFAKTIFEPFETNFFYGNPLTNSLMGEQDVINSLYNMLVDKTYRTLDKQKYVGDINRDAFDLDGQSSMDSIIYMPDVRQVKEGVEPGILPGEIKMVDLISRGLDLSSIDENQQGIRGGGTAREVIVAAENAKKLVGTFKMFRTNLWKQKTILRIVNILQFYTQDDVEKYIGEKDPDTGSRILTVENTELSNGDRGDLGILMVDGDNKMPSREKLDDLEREAEDKGKDVEFIAVKSDYIKNFHFDITVIADSVDDKDDTLEQAKFESKLAVIAKAFPEFFSNNKAQFFKEAIEAYGGDPTKYDMSAPRAPELAIAGQGEPAQNGDSVV